MFFSSLQSDIFIYNRWGHRWNLGIHWPHWIHFLFSYHGNGFYWTHNQGKIFSSFILWQLEPDSTWWLHWWPYGTLLYLLLIFFSFWNERSKRIYTCLCSFLPFNSNSLYSRIVYFQNSLLFVIMLFIPYLNECV